MDVIIRNETEKDFRAVEELTREAFWNLYVPGCDEHFLVHKMRSHPDFIQELAFVAESGGRIVGNIMYTRSRLLGEEGRELEAATFGPLCVLPNFQHRGIGGRLIRHTADLCRERGLPAIVILGDPHNYCRHGFRSGRDLGVADPNGDYPYGLLVLELREKALAGGGWRFRYSDVYDVDKEEAEKFDRTFPPKEKCRRPSQDVYSIGTRAFVR